MFWKDKTVRLKILASTVAGLGAYFMLYLTRLHFMDTGSSVCDLGEGLSCELVNKSQYAEILSIPIAVLGMLFFLAIPYLLYAKPLKKPWRAVLLASVFSLVFGVYLSFIENLLIGSICLFCESSKVLMIALIGISAYGVRHEKEELPWSWVALAIAVGLLFSGFAYLIQ